MPPVIAGLAAVFSAVGFSAGVASAIAVSVLSTGVSLAISSVAKLFAPRPKVVMASQGTQFNVRQPISSWRIIYGRTNTGGVVTYIETTGANKEFLHLVLTIAGHEVSEIGNFYFDSKLVPKPTAFKVWQADKYFFLGDRIYENSLVWVCIQAGRSGLSEPDWVTGSTGIESDHNAKWKKEGLTPLSLANSVTIEKNLGTEDQAAFPNLVADSAGLWTSNHRQRGRAGVHMRLTFNADAFPTGIPVITFDVDGKKVEDPRVSASPELSENPALCIRDYLLNAEYGMGVDPARIDEDSFIAAANICDEEVDLRDSGSPARTEKRYTLNGLFETSETPVNIIQAMLSSCAGRLIYTNGKYRLFVGAYVAANPSAITEDDLRGPIVLDTRTSRRDIFNSVRGVYISPANYWQPSDFPPVQGAGYITEDGGQIWNYIELPFTQSRSMAQRLAKIMLEKARRQLTIQLQCFLTQYEVAPLDTIKITNQRFGWTDKTFEVVDIKLATEEGENGTLVIGVDIIARETDANVYAWDPDTDETLVDNAGLVVLPDPLTVEPVTYLAATSDDSTSIVVDGIRSPRILAQWSATPDQFVIQGGHLEVYLRETSSPSLISQRVATLPGDATEVYIQQGLVVGTSYEVEVVAVAINSVRASSGFSDPVTVSMTSSGVITGAGNRAYRPLTNPLTATDAGGSPGSATIDIDDFTMRIQGLGDVVYDLGAIPDLEYDTLYFVYFDDPNVAGGAVTYEASETKEDALDAPGRFFLGSCRTPVEGGPDTIGNDDGGAGGQVGMVTRHYPIATEDPTTEIGNGVVTDPMNWVDGSPLTYTRFQAFGNSLGGNAAYVNPDENPLAFSSIRRNFKTVKVKVDYEVPTNSLDGSNDLSNPRVLISVYAPNGTPFFMVNMPHGATQARTIAEVSIPVNINLSQVRPTIQAAADITDTTGEVDLRVYDMWIETTE